MQKLAQTGCFLVETVDRILISPKFSFKIKDRKNGHISEIIC